MQQRGHRSLGLEQTALTAAVGARKRGMYRGDEGAIRERGGVGTVDARAQAALPGHAGRRRLSRGSGTRRHSNSSRMWIGVPRLWLVTLRDARRKRRCDTAELGIAMPRVRFEWRAALRFKWAACLAGRAESTLCRDCARLRACEEGIEAGERLNQRLRAKVVSAKIGWQELFCGPRAEARVPTLGGATEP